MSGGASFRAHLVDTLWVVGVFAFVCAVWEFAVKAFDLPVFVLPPVEDVVADLLSAPGLFASHALFTVGMALAGFAVVSSRILDRILMTFLALLHSVPKVALAPLFVIWLGAGFEPKIAIAAMMSVLVIVVDAVAGLRSVDPEMVNLARVYRASPLAIMLKVRLPAALPHIFASWKVAISLSLIGAIVGEYVGGQRGLGYLILVSQGSFDTPRVFASVLLLSVIATALYYLIALAERMFAPWHVSRRAGGH